MELLQIFSNPEFGQVRIITIKNEPWFVGKDVVIALGYVDTSDAIKRHVDIEDKLTRCFTDTGQGREMYIINESGLYSLILGSKLQSAKQFKRWLTNEVIPTIRKHGMYATDELLDNPDLLIQVATALKVEREKNKLLETENFKLKPKAEFFDAVANSKDAIEIGQVAKVLGNIGRNRLFELLRDQKILMSNNQPYQKYIDNGYFRVIEQKYSKSSGDININIKTLVYQKGVDYIRKILN